MWRYAVILVLAMLCLAAMIEPPPPRYKAQIDIPETLYTADLLDLMNVATKRGERKIRASDVVFDVRFIGASVNGKPALRRVTAYLEPGMILRIDNRKGEFTGLSMAIFSPFGTVVKGLFEREIVIIEAPTAAATS